MGFAGYVARIGAITNARKILLGKLEGKRRLGRPRCKSEVNIEMDFKQGMRTCTGFVYVDRCPSF